MIFFCGEVFLVLVIEYCSKNILFELIWIENYEEGEGEFVLKLDEEYYYKLILCFLNEISINFEVIFYVLYYFVMEDSGFC